MASHFDESPQAVTRPCIVIWRLSPKSDIELPCQANYHSLKKSENIKEEIGDVLFSIVNLSRFLDINSEDALRMTISKFENRFGEIEKELIKRGKSFTDSSLEEMNAIWNEVKKKAHA